MSKVRVAVTLAIALCTVAWPTTAHAATPRCTTSPYPAPIELHADWRDASGLEVSPVLHTYNPTVIAGQGIARWEAGDRQQIVARADWLLSQQQPDGRFIYTVSFGGQPLPWWSALPEGFALSVYVRAYEQTGEAKYLTAADAAFSTFTRDQAHGGVTVADGGFTWFEEYLPPYAPHVLNGAIWALFGVMDYHECRGGAASQQVIDTELATLHANLPRYDAGTWSLYDLRQPPNPATIGYHRIHVDLLRGLGRVTGDRLFTETADRWAGDRPPPVVANWLHPVEAQPPRLALTVPILLAALLVVRARDRAAAAES